MNAVAHQRASHKLNDYAFMNQHDNVMGDPDYMAAFLHEVPDAFIDVVSHDMILTVRKNYIDGVEKALKNIPDQVTLGHEGDFPIITATQTPVSYTHLTLPTTPYV